MLAEWYNSFLETVNSVEVTTGSAVFRLFLSMLLGSCVGLERKRKGQMAGLRTFSLIAMGATLAMLLSIYVPQEYLGLKNGDPGRIAAQVITGIGFLGAGAIIQMRGSVRGLTTAASIWMVATIGMAVGVGMYTVSVVATALILFILLLLEQFEHRVHVGWQTRIISIEMSEIVHDIDDLRKCFVDNHVEVTSVYVQYQYSKPLTQINFVVLVKDHLDFIHLFSIVRGLRPSITYISVANQLGS